MAESGRNIKMSDIGIGSVLKGARLVVPPHQREYSWTETQVVDLFEDFQKAIDDKEPDYFLGTITLTGSDPSLPDVTDGQQRLATTTLLLSAMRDYFFALNDEFHVANLEQDYLLYADTARKRYLPRLTLNVDDKDFFAKQIATKPGDPQREEAGTKSSHHLIKQATLLAQQRVAHIVGGYTRPADAALRLEHWKDFITNNAFVIVLRMPSDLNAYRMFETLNDRGLKTSQVDIIKSFLFRESKELEKAEMQPKWSRLTGIIESLDGDDILLTFMRHFVITKHGMTRAANVYDRIESAVSGKHRAVEFVGEMEENASDYVAILSPEHRKWSAYSPNMRDSIRTMRFLKGIPLRPLMLAVARRFSPRETEHAFRLFINWTVRFLIVGGGRSGSLEESYAATAHEVASGKMKTARELVARMEAVVPKDPVFEEAFSTARIPKNNFARYILRALELKITGAEEPEFIPNDDGGDINLEHVLPENPGANWPSITPEMADALSTRIGNMVLLQVSKNTILGNSSFQIKKEVLRKSAYVLTSQVGKSKTWGAKEIAARQQQLAKLAVQTWTITL